MRGERDAMQQMSLAALLLSSIIGYQGVQNIPIVHNMWDSSGVMSEVDKGPKTIVMMYFTYFTTTE